MDLDLDLDSIFNGFGSGFGFKCVLGLDWILDLKKFMDLDLDLDLFLDMDSNPNPRIQIRTSLPPGWPSATWHRPSATWHRPAGTSAHRDETHLYWYFSNLCEDRKKICKRVQHNISIITACDIQVEGVRPRGFLY